MARARASADSSQATAAIAAPAAAALAAITVAAAVLRLAKLGAVPLDPFYDAAVRSMSLSLHNFFFGVFEPSGSLAIDKPPIDLWLQVISVKLFGFNSTALKLPQAIAGTLAVPLLYAAVRRVFGSLAGLASALVLAVLPIAVLTARSDTMDAVMMLLSVAALWLLVRYAERRQPRYLMLAAAAVGVAFNVKLFQALICVPGLGLLALMTAPAGRRLRHVAAAAAVGTAVAVSWLSATLVVPGAPFAIGSTNGSAWNAAFVFNGYDRIAKPATQGDLAGGDTGSGRARPAGNTELQRAAVPIGTPSPLRLFDHDGPLSGLRLGYVLLVALLLGVPALATAARRRPASGAGADADAVGRATAVALLVWLATGVGLFSAMARLHPRYTEGFTPAVAAATGIGLAYALRGGVRDRALAAVAALALAAYGHYLLGTSSTLWLLSALAALLALLAVARPLDARARAVLGGALAVAALLLPVNVAAGLVRHSESDAGRVGVARPGETEALSAYLIAHRGGARYELATASATQAAALIVHDAQAVLVLTSFDARPLVPVARLAALAADGSVRYALTGGGCGPHSSPALAACSAAAVWVRAHGVDVSRAAGLRRTHVLWRLH